MVGPMEGTGNLTDGIGTGRGTETGIEIGTETGTERGIGLTEKRVRETDATIPTGKLGQELCTEYTAGLWPATAAVDKTLCVQFRLLLGAS